MTPGDPGAIPAADFEFHDDEIQNLLTDIHIQKFLAEISPEIGSHLDASHLLSTPAPSGHDFLHDLPLSPVASIADFDNPLDLHSAFASEASSGGRSGPMRNSVDPGRKDHKAAREKLRRTELNEKFIQLGMMLGIKSDKVSILNHSMAYIQVLKRENDALKAETARMKAENSALSAVLQRLVPSVKVAAPTAPTPIPSTLFGIADTDADGEDEVIHAPVA